MYNRRKSISSLSNKSNFCLNKFIKTYQIVNISKIRIFTIFKLNGSIVALWVMKSEKRIILVAAGVFLNNFSNYKNGDELKYRLRIRKL